MANPYYPLVRRPYSKQQERLLRGPYAEKHTLAEEGAKELRELLGRHAPVRALGAMTGGQAVQMVKAGLQAIYVSGWQVAADANTSGQTYPDQSLYPVDSVPTLVRRINDALLRAAQIEAVDNGIEYHNRVMRPVPLIADAEAGFGGPLNAFELCKSLIRSGAAGIHLEDQLSSEKKCGHLGGKVLIPTKQAIRNLIAARLAADVCETSTVVIARTDADSAKLITSDVDPVDQPFIKKIPHHNWGGEIIGSNPVRTPEGFYELDGKGIDRAVARGLAYAPYADMIWMETSTPDLGEAHEFAKRIHEKFPDRLLAYNCSPSFNWKKKLSEEQIARFQHDLGQMGYAFQFVTLAGFHALNASMFELADKYRTAGMTAYANLQEYEFAMEEFGYTATKHQREVGTAYFDLVSQTISGGESSTTAMEGSTEKDQFR